MKKEPFTKRSLKKDQRNQFQQPKKKVKKNRYSDLFGLSIIILLGIFVYSDSFHCSFQFDDLSCIVNNTKIWNLADVKTWWNYAPHRPFAFFTFALNYHFNQFNVLYWHMVNLIIHLINAGLVWWLVMLIFTSPVMKDLPISRHKHVLSLLTALLFVSHPLATQSVTYIYQRLASMVTMFYLLSLVFYMKARLAKKSTRSRYMLFAGSLISMVLAMFTKENSFTLPFVIVLIEMFFFTLEKRSLTFRDWRVILLIAAILLIIIIIPLKFSFNIFKPIPPSFGNAHTVTPFNYFLTQFTVIVKYIQLLILPINQNLDYDFPVSNSFFEIKTMLSFIVLASLIILGIFLYKNYRIISFGIFWFFLTLSIESSFIPISDVIFEHRTYLPSVGFFLILSTVIYGLLGNRYKVFASVIMITIVIINSYLTYNRNKIWKDELTLWSDVVSKSPDKARPRNCLGLVYKNLGQWNKALDNYNRAIGIYPEFSSAYSNRGVVYSNLGQWDKAIDDYSRAIEIEPNLLAAYYSRGSTYGKMRYWDKSIADFSKVIEIDPKYEEAYYKRGSTYGNLGHWDQAIADFSKAIEIDPKYADAYFNRGVTYCNLEQWDKAIEDYSKAIEIDPNFTNAYTNRDMVYKKLGREKMIR